MAKINGITKKQTVDYIRNFVDKMVDEEIPAPFISDCWMCYMTIEKGKSVGDLIEPTHIEGHVANNEYTPSLLLRAIVEDKDNVSETSKQIAFDIWRYKGRQYNNFTQFKREISRALIKYISKRARIIHDEGDSENQI